MYQCNSVKDANWPLGVISQHTLHNIKLASETGAWCDITGMGQGHYSLNPTAQSGCCSAANPGTVLWVPSGSAAPGASCGSCREPAALQSSKVCALLAAPQICPCHSGKAGPTYRTPMSHQVTLYTLPQNGRVSNSMLRHKAEKNLSYLEAWSCKQWLPHILLIILLKSKIQVSETSDIYLWLLSTLIFP